jgi:cyclin-C
VISKLGKKLQLRQRVVATAIVFFKRFYLKNAYCETDPFIVIAACCYVAAKAEESPVHIKNVVTEARLLFGSESLRYLTIHISLTIPPGEEYGIKSFPSDHSKLAEMEFYLVDDLECDLVVFHPYRTLMALCGKADATATSEAEAGELGVGIQDGARYWGTGEGKLELQEGALQTAW